VVSNAGTGDPERYSSGAGGSGLVVIKYPAKYRKLSSITGLSYTQTVVDNFRIYEFTAGTGSIKF
jgi:hypothetical protein